MEISFNQGFQRDLFRFKFSQKQLCCCCCFSQRGFMALSIQQSGPLHIMGLINSKKNANRIQRAEKLCLRFTIYDSRMIIENKDELYQDIIWNELRQFSCHSSLVLWLIFRMLRVQSQLPLSFWDLLLLQSVKGDTKKSRGLSFKSGICLKLELKIKKRQSESEVALVPHIPIRYEVFASSRKINHLVLDFKNPSAVQPFQCPAWHHFISSTSLLLGCEVAIGCEPSEISPNYNFQHCQYPN